MTRAMHGRTLHRMNKTTQITVRLTPAERAKLEAAAKRASRVLGDWIRLVSLEAATKKPRRVA